MNTIKRDTPKVNVGLPAVLTSKRFVTAVVGIGGMILVGLEPRLLESAPVIEASILAITSLVITSFTGQDWKVADAQGASKYQPQSING